jgi:hypothetical protein
VLWCIVAVLDKFGFLLPYLSGPVSPASSSFTSLSLTGATIAHTAIAIGNALEQKKRGFLGRALRGI